MIILLLRSCLMTCLCAQAELQGSLLPADLNINPGHTELG